MIKRVAPQRQDLREHSQAFQLRRGRKPPVQTDECERARKLFLDQQGCAKLARVSGSQRMPRQQRSRPSSNGKDVRDFIPTAGEGIEPLDDLTTLLP